MKKFLILILIILFTFNIKLFAKDNKQYPWCRKPKECNCKEFRCFVNKHLQRKCEWV